MGFWIPWIVWVASAAIYDGDHRVGIENVYNPSQVARARSIALVPQESALTPLAGGAFRMDQETFGQYQAGIDEPLCKGVRFRHEPMVKASAGTGFLVAPQVLVTAGHVIESEADCRSKAVVFGYWSPHHRGVFSASQVYRCAKVLRTENHGTRDFAVILLDRPVEGRKPLKFRTQGKMPPGPVWMAGHPWGLPLKVTTTGGVTDHSHPDYFRATLDTFPGNSGGPVFGVGGTVEGILVEGETTDMTLRGEYPGGCWYPKVYCTAQAPSDVACDETRFEGARVVRAAVWAPYVASPPLNAAP